MKSFKYLILIVLLTILFQPIPALAQEKVNIYFFYGQGCPHCGKETDFLDKLEEERDDIEIFRYEIYNNSSNANLLKKVGQSLEADVRGVPVCFIEDEYVGGFYNEEVTGGQIIEKIEKCKSDQCTNQIAAIVDSNQEIDNNLNSDQESVPTNNFSGATIGLGMLLLVIIGFAVYKIKN